MRVSVFLGNASATLDFSLGSQLPELALPSRLNISEGTGLAPLPASVWTLPVPAADINASLTLSLRGGTVTLAHNGTAGCAVVTIGGGARSATVEGLVNCTMAAAQGLRLVAPALSRWQIAGVATLDVNFVSSGAFRACRSVALRFAPLTHARTAATNPTFLALGVMVVAANTAPTLTWKATQAADPSVTAVQVSAGYKSGPLALTRLLRAQALASAASANHVNIVLYEGGSAYLGLFTVADDADAVSQNTLVAQLAVSAGTLCVADTFQCGASLALQGMAQQLAAALSTVLYTPSASFIGTASVTVSVADSGLVGTAEAAQNSSYLRNITVRRARASFALQSIYLITRMAQVLAVRNVEMSAPTLLLSAEGVAVPFSVNFTDVNALHLGPASMQLRVQATGATVSLLPSTLVNVSGLTGNSTADLSASFQCVNSSTATLFFSALALLENTVQNTGLATLAVTISSALTAPLVRRVHLRVNESADTPVFVLDTLVVRAVSGVEVQLPAGRVDDPNAAGPYGPRLVEVVGPRQPHRPAFALTTRADGDGGRRRGRGQCARNGLVHRALVAACARGLGVPFGFAAAWPVHRRHALCSHALQSLLCTGRRFCRELHRHVRRQRHGPAGCAGAGILAQHHRGSE